LGVIKKGYTNGLNGVGGFGKRGGDLSGIAAHSTPMEPQPAWEGAGTVGSLQALELIAITFPTV
jgi:hypothetical protein